MPCQSPGISMVAEYLCPGQRDSRQMWNMPETLRATDPDHRTVGIDSVGMDLFKCSKKTYLLIVDHFSRCIEAAELKVSWGYRSSCEGGFRSSWISRDCSIRQRATLRVSETFRKCAQESRFTHTHTHITSSPRYPQANGEAGRAVQTVKSLWK